MDGTLQPEDLPLLDAGRMEWSAGSAQRFAGRFAEAYDTVLERCAERLQKNLSSAANDEFALVNALTGARRTLAFLFQVAHLKPIPEDLRAYLTGTVDRYAQQTQSSLENSAGADRSGRLASLLKNHSLCKFDKQTATVTTDDRANSDSDSTQSFRPKRRLLL